MVGVHCVLMDPSDVATFASHVRYFFGPGTEDWPARGGGTVYSTATKASAPIGLAQLAEICAAVQIPVVAIGGITAENAAACIEAGAAGVAVVSTLFATEDVVAVAEQLRAVVDEALFARDAQR